MSETINQWLELPIGCTLNIAVRGKTNRDINFVVRARLVPHEGSDVVTIRDYQLRPGPYQELVPGGAGCTIWLQVRFLSDEDETVILASEVINASGETEKDWRNRDFFQQEYSGKSSNPSTHVSLYYINDQ